MKLGLAPTTLTIFITLAYWLSGLVILEDDLYPPIGTPPKIVTKSFYALPVSLENVLIGVEQGWDRVVP